MAHYAFINENNIVTEVIVGCEESELPEGITSWEEHYGQFRGQACKRTSYNTVGGVHLSGGTPFRKNYAGIGYMYDEERDVFIPPQPFSSWVIDEETFLWVAPIPRPSEDEPYYWDEQTLQWILGEEGEQI